ncbi:hypothetical protein BJV78DRAFT_1156503 [Lactifluus subvellereus]|nr:hypothetical protein BJV78DRAFT_1156503 [Lactifluus subvellereus]
MSTVTSNGLFDPRPSSATSAKSGSSTVSSSHLSTTSSHNVLGDSEYFQSDAGALISVSDHSLLASSKPSGEQGDHTLSFTIPAPAGFVNTPTHHGGVQPVINPQEAFDSLAGGSPLTLHIGTLPPPPAGDNKAPSKLPRMHGRPTS